MPLVRVEVRNEYGLGSPELYRKPNKEDPKELLDGVVVSGLVGVLRQIGDLTEFAAEVFHGLQEEVMIASSRAHNLMARVQQIEASVSPVEKAISSHRNHLYFAYSSGSNWHARLLCHKNQFASSDMPPFIMDSYENCCSPPHLHLLDKFDPGGRGSCFKRYSDPTFFKRSSAGSSKACTLQKIVIDKQGRSVKKRRSWQRNGDASRGSSFSNLSGRKQFTRMDVNGQTSHSQRMSSYDATLRSDSGKQPKLDPENEPSYTECVHGQRYSMQPEKQEFKASLYHRNSIDYNFLEEKVADLSDDFQNNLSSEQTGYSSSSITWDENAKTPQCMTMQKDDPHGNLGSTSLNFDLGTWGRQDINAETAMTKSDGTQLDDIDSETDQFMDALNTVASDTETDIDCAQVEHYLKFKDKTVDESHHSNFKSDISVNSSQVNSNCGHNCISVALQSLSAAYSSTREVAAKNKFNSQTIANNADLLPNQGASELLNQTRLKAVDSHEKGIIENDVNVKSVFSEDLKNNCRNVADQLFSGRSKDLSGGGSQFMSSSSSPPLEHMKVTFRPIDSIETTKLKLKFPDGNSNHGSDEYIFPSFQLVPEVCTARHDIGSDSEDDTFYRSSPAVSNDSFSHQSDSNSEQWEFRESPSSKQNHFSDALRRISLTESTSSIRENGMLRHRDIHAHQLPSVKNGEQHSQSCCLLHLPKLDFQTRSSREEMQKDSSAVDHVEPRFAPSPPPPPLPPAQWRNVKPNLDDIQNGHPVIMEGVNHLSDLASSASTVPLQPKPSPLKQDRTVGTKMTVKTKQSDSEKTSGRREANQAAHGKNIDHREEFLNLIRTKAYSLRPTVMAKSTVSSEPPANGNVTAILQMANTIRQAVGSDDGGRDDNWSDT